ncbi:fimbrial biogenesis chaperone [Phytobacter sp. AG2a]
MGSGYYSILLLLITLINFSAQAGIVVAGTRVVYPADKKEVTVSMKNTGQSPALVQSWIDTGDPTEVPQNIQVPFVLTPPIARIDGGKGQTLRLMYTGGALPQDRESVFWLNILSVPPKKSDAHNQYLNVAYQTRIKLFYRPAGLKLSAEAAGEKLQWKREGDTLSVFNPTPYHITLLNVSGEANNKATSLQGEMIHPYEKRVIAKQIGMKSGEQINYAIVDDLGKALPLTARLN